MPAKMLPLRPLALFLLLLLLPLTAHQVLGAHVTCSYRPGNGSPSVYFYQSFCVANKNGLSYQCGQSIFENKKGVTVASWSQQARNIYEFISPCGDGGGWGLKPDGACISDLWAMCIGGNPSKDCFYMAAGDDCQWPNAILNPSNQIFIFYHTNAAAQLEE